MDEATLEEARRVLAKQACAWEGHDLEHVTNSRGDLLRVLCSRCGANWKCERTG